MQHAREFYIGGEWVAPLSADLLDVIDPAREEPCATIALGTAADIDRAVTAARAAFPGFAAVSIADRLDLLRAVLAQYQLRFEDVAEAMTLEMGAPHGFVRAEQAASGTAHLEQMIRTLEHFRFETRQGATLIRREPIGVCGLITPWNWPINQIVCKVAPALAAGCTVILKPSEIAPLSAIVWTEIMHAAGVPAGVFNLVQGDGPTVGEAMSAHPDIDMMSFTGSTRAGIRVAQAAAATVKRVAQELGGKSANILLPDADFATAVPHGVAAVFANSGQSCDAPARMLVPRAHHDAARDLARAAADRYRVGDPRDPATELGPVVSAAQFAKIQRLIETGIAEGAELVTGGPGRPEHLNRGYYVRPTVFAAVRPDMVIAQEEVFGPVLSILPYDSEEQAIAIANDTPYGLAACVQSRDPAAAQRAAARLRAGTVSINGALPDLAAPFGGYKQSGNGREYADWGLHEYLELKAVIGYGAE